MDFADKPSVEIPFGDGISSTLIGTSPSRLCTPYERRSEVGRKVVLHLLGFTKTLGWINILETLRWTHQIHPLVSEDYHLNPTKPTLLGEGAYELDFVWQ